MAQWRKGRSHVATLVVQLRRLYCWVVHQALGKQLLPAFSVKSLGWRPLRCSSSLQICISFGTLHIELHFLNAAILYLTSVANHTWGGGVPLGVYHSSTLCLLWLEMEFNSNLGCLSLSTGKCKWQPWKSRFKHRQRDGRQHCQYYQRDGQQCIIEFWWQGKQVDLHLQ